MDFKQNINYFKKSDAPKIIGAALAIIGLLMLWIGLGYGYIGYILMVVFIVAGVAMFIYGSSGRASENDIDSDIARQMEGIEVNLEEDKKRSKKVLKHIPPKAIEGYVYNDGAMLKKAKNGSLRSSEYTKTMLYVLSDSLYISSRTISVTEPNVKDDTFDISYDLIEKVEITRGEKDISFGKKTFKAKECFFSITYDGGKNINFPIHDDVDADELVNTIEKTMQSYKSKTE